MGNLVSVEWQVVAKELFGIVSQTGKVSSGLIGALSSPKYSVGGIGAIDEIEERIADLMALVTGLDSHWKDYLMTLIFEVGSSEISPDEAVESLQAMIEAEDEVSA